MTTVHIAALAAAGLCLLIGAFQAGRLPRTEIANEVGRLGGIVGRKLDLSAATIP